MSEVSELTLTEFLLARVAEDEESLPCANCGRPVEPDGPREDGEFGHVAAALRGGDPVAEEFWADPCPSPEPTRRSLAECEAKRSLIGHLTNLAASGPVDSYNVADEALWCTLRILALPYADHPDYREEWRP